MAVSHLESTGTAVTSIPRNHSSVMPKHEQTGRKWSAMRPSLAGQAWGFQSDTNLKGLCRYAYQSSRVGTKEGPAEPMASLSSYGAKHVANTPPLTPKKWDHQSFTELSMSSCPLLEERAAAERFQVARTCTDSLSAGLAEICEDNQSYKGAREGCCEEHQNRTVLWEDELFKGLSAERPRTCAKRSPREQADVGPLCGLRPCTCRCLSATWGACVSLRAGFFLPPVGFFLDPFSKAVSAPWAGLLVAPLVDRVRKKPSSPTHGFFYPLPCTQDEKKPRPALIGL